MVYYFTSSEGFTIYMGKDKYENEELLRHGFNEDIWFHVDNLSSAHVYLRLPLGNSKLDDITPTCLEECAQLVKENSIEGCKKKKVHVIYTKYPNLNKTQGMDVGQVGFKNDDRVRRVLVAEKDKDIIKTLNRTKEERFPDLEEERRQRELLYKAERKKFRQRQEAEEKRQREERQQQVQLRSYASLMQRDTIDSQGGVVASADVSAAIAYEDDFM